MTGIAVLFIGISLLLYVLLGGADFGAGIIELFSGNKSINAISRAIAPVWEANHIWIIVVIVVLFNAFPAVYSTITMNLHIPLMMVLFGIIFRGTAFTFRYYDPYSDRSHAAYTFIFKLFSLLTPFFLGITLGAVIEGRITNDPAVSFYERFVNPWLSLFPITLGLFVIILFAYLAAVYLAGEPDEDNTNTLFIRYAKRLLVILVICGGLVFLAAEVEGLHLFRRYLNSWISIASAVFASLLLPAFIISLNQGFKNLTRLIAGAQTGAILIGWFGIQYPVLVSLKNADPLTIYNTVAPDKTLTMMIIALIVGLAFVIPLLLYLFKVFKFSTK